MKKFLKLLSVVLAGVLLVTSIGITSFAESIADTAKSVDSGKAFTVKLSDDEYHDYKIKLNESGDLSLYLSSPVERTGICLYDLDGNNIYPTEESSNIKSGRISVTTIGYGKGTNCYWNSTMEKFKGTIKYANLDKGTYYVRIYRALLSDYAGTGKATVKFTYPQAEKADEKEETGTITALSLSLKKGETLQLDAVLEAQGNSKLVQFKKICCHGIV